MRFCDTNVYNIIINDYKVIEYELIETKSYPYKDYYTDIIDLEHFDFNVYDFTSPCINTHDFEFTDVKVELLPQNKIQFFILLDHFLNDIKSFCDSNMSGEDILKNAIDNKIFHYNKRIVVNFSITPIRYYSHHRITDYPTKERGDKMYDVMIYDIIVDNYKILKYESKGIDNPLFRDEKLKFDVYDVFLHTKHELKFNEIKARLHPQHEEMFFMFLKQFLYVVKILCENGTHGELAIKIAMNKTRHLYDGDIDEKFKVKPITH